MKRMIVIIILLAIVCVYWGCSKKEMKPADDNICMPRFPNDSVTYDNYVKGIVQTYCTPACHNGSGGLSPGDFRTYQGLLPYTSQFQFRVTQDDADMPKDNAPLPKNIRDSLAIWIGNCTPEK